MIISQKSRTNFEVSQEAREHNVLFISDVHYDSMKCDRPRLVRHLNEAKAIGADVFVFGDWFDLMQGKYDPRGTYSDLRPEYKSITYLDDVIDDSYEFLKKHPHVRFLGRGNHETNIEKRLHTSPLDRLASLLRHDKHDINVGGYAGYLKFRLTKPNGHARRTSLVHYHHGYGGNAKRSKGVLEVDLDSAQFPDASVIVRGHTHQKWYVPTSVDRVNDQLQSYQESVHHLRLGSYKLLGDRFAGWATEKGFNTPRLGGWFGRFHMVGKHELPRWEWREAQ